MVESLIQYQKGFTIDEMQAVAAVVEPQVGEFLLNFTHESISGSVTAADGQTYSVQFQRSWDK